MDSRPPAVSMSHTGPLYCVFMLEVDRLGTYVRMYAFGTCTDTYDDCVLYVCVCCAIASYLHYTYFILNCSGMILIQCQAHVIDIPTCMHMSTYTTCQYSRTVYYVPEYVCIIPTYLY